MIKAMIELPIEQEIYLAQKEEKKTSDKEEAPRFADELDLPFNDEIMLRILYES